jgi:hypothetical protein
MRYTCVPKARGWRLKIWSLYFRERRASPRCPQLVESAPPEPASTPTFRPVVTAPPTYPPPPPPVYRSPVSPRRTGPGPPPPPRSPSPSAPPAAPQRSGLPWMVIAGVLAFVVLAGSWRPAPREVRRAQPIPQSLSPAAAQPATPASYTPVPQYSSGQWLTLPDGRSVFAVFKGYLSSVDQLPRTGGQLGDEYAIGSTGWILTTASANTSRVGWVDPPVSAQTQVRRAQPVDSVLVRRAESVTPRAQLVRLHR